MMRHGQQFLALELVDGESLDGRIARGPIPVDEALGIATQIAEALEAAHEKGIIHRDLKPANIALTSNGSVKVLDFGLAKAMEPANAMSFDSANSSTITSPAMMTGVGMILGTAAYMSPEQAKGRPADKRSDVWAFGCVLFEMLSGKRAFSGEGVFRYACRRAAWGAGVERAPPAISHRMLALCFGVVCRRTQENDCATSATRALNSTMCLQTDQRHDRRGQREYLGWGAAVLLLVPLAILWWRGTTPQTLPQVRTRRCAASRPQAGDRQHRVSARAVS
jgi:serine/threonine protein kinase